MKYLPTFLTITFIILKLTNVINWSWFYVLLPSIIELSFAFLLLLIFIIYKFLGKD